MTDADQPNLSSVVVECELDAQPETVWRALTVPEIVAEWLAPNSIDAKTGEAFGIELAPKEGGHISCVVLDADPPQRLSYSWRTAEDDARAGSLDTVVTFELAPTADGGTRLRITHTGLPAVREERPPATKMISVGREPGACRRRPLTWCTVHSPTGRRGLVMELRRAA
jgi:uncharacterized protein YndB with AHSA1/START domain